MEEFADHMKTSSTQRLLRVRDILEEELKQAREKLSETESKLKIVNDAMATKLVGSEEEQQRKVVEVTGQKDVMAEALRVYFPSLYYYSLLEYPEYVEPGTGGHIGN
jgi:ribosomal protein L10